VSGWAYGALAALVIFASVALTLWLGFRAARQAGGAEAERDQAATVAKHAREANEVRAGVAAADDAAARERLQRWRRD
jgi:hypothetical protein